MQWLEMAYRSPILLIKRTWRLLLRQAGPFRRGFGTTEKQRLSIASSMTRKKLRHISRQRKRRGRGKTILAEELYIRRFIHAPRHHRAIAALCHRYITFSGTVRLVKRWLASHWLLHGHIAVEAVEIICAHFFIGDGCKLATDADAEQAASHLVPVSKERGFAAVVQFLAELFGFPMNGASVV
jgi:hypothetical protein